jgi:hypothetical protein
MAGPPSQTFEDADLVATACLKQPASKDKRALLPKSVLLSNLVLLTSAVSPNRSSMRDLGSPNDGLGPKFTRHSQPRGRGFPSNRVIVGFDYGVRTTDFLPPVRSHLAQEENRNLAAALPPFHSSTRTPLFTSVHP